VRGPDDDSSQHWTVGWSSLLGGGATRERSLNLARIADCPRDVLHSWQSVTPIYSRQNMPPETAQSGGRHRTRAVFTLFLAALCAVSMAAQAPKIDTSGIGPRVGQKVPDFAGTDQLGRKHTFASSLGAKGAMLVFFRSADW
jgi:hypothetical protein